MFINSNEMHYVSIEKTNKLMFLREINAVVWCIREQKLDISIFM
jgi:hypothetical protein